MCGICSLTSLPVCAVGAVCGTSASEIMGIASILSATSVGTFSVLRKSPKKSDYNEKK